MTVADDMCLSCEGRQLILHHQHYNITLIKLSTFPVIHYNPYHGLRLLNKCNED